MQLFFEKKNDKNSIDFDILWNINAIIVVIYYSNDCRYCELKLSISINYRQMVFTIHEIKNNFGKYAKIRSENMFWIFFCFFIQNILIQFLASKELVIDRIVADY